MAPYTEFSGTGRAEISGKRSTGTPFFAHSRPVVAQSCSYGTGAVQNRARDPWVPVPASASDPAWPAPSWTSKGGFRTPPPSGKNANRPVPFRPAPMAVAGRHPQLNRLQGAQPWAPAAMPERAAPAHRQRMYGPARKEPKRVNPAARADADHTDTP